MTVQYKKRWYTEKKNSDSVRDALCQTFDQIRNDLSAKQELDHRHLRLYANVDHIQNPYFQTSIEQSLFSLVNFNVVKSIVDTLKSKIGNIQPGITFLTSGADFNKRNNIKELNDFVYSMFKALKVYEIGAECFQDALITGTGFVKVYRKGNGIKVERVLPNQVYVDYYDGLYGKPSQMFQCKLMSKSVLESIVGKKLDINPVYQMNQNTSVADLVEVVEGWYLCEKEDKRRHVICTKDELILDEPYLCPHNPIQEIRYKKLPIGYYGEGAIEGLVGIQVEINKLCRMIQRAVHVGSNLWAFVPSQSKVREEHFSNRRKELGVIQYQGMQPPTLQTFQTIHPELFRYLELLMEKAYEMSGMSQMSAAGRKDKGVTSGVAIQNTLDIETQRFMDTEINLHNFYERIARQIVWYADDIGENEDLKVSFAEEDSYREINWRDIDLDGKDKLEVQSHKVNLLPRTPEGKLERINDLLQNGLLDPQEARKLMQFPDLKMDEDLASSGRDIIKKNIDNLLSGKDYIEPDQYMDLQFCMEYAVQRYNLERLKDRLDEETEAKLLDYIGQCENLLDQMQQEAMAEQMPPEMSPEAAALPPEGVQ